MWVKLTAEPFPRLSIVRQVKDDGATYAGPFGSKAVAEQAVAAVHEVVPLRQCTGRLSRKGTGTACALAEMGRCGAPCEGRQSPDDYAAIAQRVADALGGDGHEVLDALAGRLARLATAERFEDAAVVRDRMLSLVRAAARTQRLLPVAVSPEIIAAAPTPAGGWEFTCVRYGRFAGATVCPPRADTRTYIAALRESAEHVERPQAPIPAATPEETEKILRWLEQPGVRIVDIDGIWACPVGGAVGAQAALDRTIDRADVPGFEESTTWRGHGTRRATA